MKFLHTLRRVFSDKGLLLTLALGLLLLFVFYGRLLRHPSETYFGGSGDGLQVYYQTLYHTKYDPEFWRQQSINYPYGESIFFTSAMPMVNNLVKIFGPGADTAGVGLINLIMLFSMPAGALFIYLIFRHLRLPWLYGSVTAVAIAFFSPQIGRMSGHYSLSWVFLIPAMIFLFLRFYDYPSIKKSWAIAVLGFLAAATHLYFFVFFAAIAGFYWLALFVTRDRGFGRFLFALKHFSIQVILPYAILQALILYSDTAGDRTQAPWGYLVFHSNTSGVFFPLFQFYRPLFEKIASPERVEAEGIAYVGLAALLGLAVVLFSQLYVLARFRWRRILSVTDSKPLNIIFWTSLFLLFIAFGRPFIGGQEEWLSYLGPLRQFRAIGRFTWLFYYMANIIAVYRIYKITEEKKILKYIAMSVVMIFLLTDMLWEKINANFAERLDNHIAVLEDEQNQLEANAWLRGFDAQKFQAILPLPYFHIGSENLSRVSPDPEIVKQSFIVSLKTGLPIMAVSSSRTSLSQSVKLISLVLDHGNPLAVLDELPDKRPFLLVVREGVLDENEKRLLSLARPVAGSAEYKLYSLDPAAIREMVRKRYAEVKAEMDSLAKYPAQDIPYMVSDTSVMPLYFSFDDMNGKPFRGKASLSKKFHLQTRIYDTEFPRKGGGYTISFWMNRATGDVFPRTVIEIFCNDPADKVPPYYQITNASVCTKMIIGEWGLMEIPLAVPCDHAHLQITLWNDDLRPDDTNEVDDLMIIPAGTHVYRSEGDTIFRDNRRYIPLK